MNIKRNLIKGIITDVLGAIIILGSVASVFLLGFNWTEAGIGAAIGAGIAGFGKK